MTKKKVAPKKPLPAKVANYNKKTELWQDPLSGRYYFVVESRGEKYPQRGEVWTVFTKTPDCKRGDYAEEIDVETSNRKNRAQVKRVAEAAIKAHFHESLRVSKIVYRIPGYMY